MMRAPPGREMEYTYSTPLISEILRSKGFVNCSSTIFADAPGKGNQTSAIGTIICGSSSRGVTRAANRPSNNAPMISSGVSLLVRKRAAMRPESPGRYGGEEIMGCGSSPSPEVFQWRWPCSRLTDLHGSALRAARGIDQHTLTFVDTGQNFSLLIEPPAESDPTQPGDMI